MEDFDFTKEYKKGDTVYLVRCYNDVGVQEVKKLKIRSVYPTYMVGCANKSKAFLMDKSMLVNIFTNNLEANERLSSIAKKQVGISISDDDLYSRQLNEEYETDLDEEGGEEDE